ncbi:hypothetical protein [Paraburkholderia sp. BCC1885]|nr:hypothetical protein [Paraburkholderia sp. BCC1885]
MNKLWMVLAVASGVVALLFIAALVESVHVEERPADAVRSLVRMR